MAYCTSCGKRIPDGQTLCKDCAPERKLAEKSRKKPGLSTAALLLILIFACCVVVYALGSLGGGTSTEPRVRPTARPTVRTVHVVEYRVGGTCGRASVTYSNAEGGTEQQDVRVPWQVKFDGDPGLFLYISAQNQNDSGTVKVEIVVDYELRKQSESKGAYVIASASDTL